MLLVLMMLVSVHPMLGVTASAASGSGIFANGGGAKSGAVYRIETLAQLLAFRDSVNNGNAYNGQSVVLAADINLKGSESNPWIPIAEFEGTFDGGGHTVSGFYIHDETPTNKGFFSKIEGTGTVKNLNLTGSVICASCSGGIAGENKGTVADCSFVGTVTGAERAYRVGGIVGENGGIVKNCYHSGAVTGWVYVGGIVGDNEGTVESCYHSGTVNGDSYIGGVAGENSDTITDCTAHAEITAETIYIGGVVGNNNSNGDHVASVKNCSHLGTIVATLEDSSGVGGVVGKNVGLVESCYHNGNISGEHLIGGVVGEHRAAATAGNSVVKTCTAEGTVSGRNRDVGGVAGSAEASVSGCSHTGAVSGDSFTGGVAGSLGSGSTMTDCHQIGDVSGNSDYVGGVTGRNSGSLNACYQIGNVTGSDTVTGGVVGQNQGDLKDCYQIGDVTGCNQVGGISGDNEGTVIHCYQEGSVVGSESYGGGACVGGVIGMNSGSVAGSYHCGDVTGNGKGTLYLGGVVGNFCEGTVANCYGIGTVKEGTENTAPRIFVGGVAGELEGRSASLQNCYHDGTIAVATTPSVGGVGGVAGFSFGSVSNCYYLENTVNGGNGGIKGADKGGQATALTAEAFGTQASFAGWDFAATWKMEAERPILQSAPEVCEIATLAELKAFADDVNGGNNYHGRRVVLTADISLNGSADNPWTPIGGSAAKFDGTFDGNGHKITGLYITDAISTGLFGFVDRNGVVQNLSVTGTMAEVMYAGGLVNNNDGTVMGCSFNGNITAKVGGNIGGLVGTNTGTVQNCYYSGNISGDISIGGIVSSNSGIVTDCYHMGNVNGCAEQPSMDVSIIGGIAGGNTGTVSNCYQFGAVAMDRDGTYFGNIVGHNDDGTVSNCCYCNTAEQIYTMNTEGTSKTTAEFANGAVASALQNGRVAPIWGQNIGTDSTPVLTADTAKAVYRVEFMTEKDGKPQIYDTKYANKNGSVSLPTAPTAEGGVFEGWCFGSDTWKASDKVAAYTRLVARWRPTPQVTDFAFTPPTELVYDGNAKTATVTATESGMGTVTVKHYDQNGTEVTPIDAGTYTVKADVTAGTAYLAATDITDSGWSFTIAKKPIDSTLALTAPVKGETPQTSITKEGEYTASIVWSPEVADGETFAKKTEYTATVTIAPDANYTTEGITAYTVDGAESVTIQTDGTVAVVFPATAGGSWLSNSSKWNKPTPSTPDSSDNGGNGNADSGEDNTATEPNAPDAPADGWKNPFEDVTEDDWFADAVEFVNRNGLMSGTAATEFDPNGKITRGMFVTVLYRAEGEPAVNKSIPFADVKADMYYANAVNWASQNGIVNGISETEFAPDAEITREQIATIIYRYAKYLGIAPEGAWAIRLNYADVSEVADYAIEGVMYCTLKGIMQGNEDNTFAPKDTATRAEIAAILQRLMQANE